MPVHAQVPFYCAPAPILITGPSAHVPGFQFIVQFGQPSSQSILTELSRKFNATDEEGLRPLGDFYKTVGFETDTVNEYVFRVKANYTQVINQTIQYAMISAGEAAGEHNLWCIASQVELVFHIITSKNPASAEAIAEALDERETARQNQLNNRFDDLQNAVIDLESAYTNLMYAFFIVAVAAFWPIAQEIHRRWPRFG